MGAAIIAIFVAVAATALLALYAKKQRAVGVGVSGGSVSVSGGGMGVSRGGMGVSGRAVSRSPAARTPATSRARSAPAPRSPYRCTSIVFDDRACGAVKTIGNKRFLQVERNVPTLPLPDCDAAQCNCRYAHHEDRRDTQEDRRHPAALKTELYDKSGKQNRRGRRRGRRRNDWA